jgi:hypothetical protein
MQIYKHTIRSVIICLLEGLKGMFEKVFKF